VCLFKCKSLPHRNGRRVMAQANDDNGHGQEMGCAEIVMRDA